MTQGYGPQDGQQGQWGQGGQGGQNPPPQAPQQQWGQTTPPPGPQDQQPQWGQTSPAAAPAQPQWGQTTPPPAPGEYPGSTGYPGAGGGPQFTPGDGVNWPRVKLLGLILLISTAVLLLIRLGSNLATFIAASDIASATGDTTPGAMALGGSLALIVLFIVNVIVSLVVIVVGIIAAVMGRGRARVGGIIAAAMIPVSVVVYWVLQIILGIVFFATGSVDATGELTATSYRISAGVDALRVLLMVGVIGLGSWYVYSTATKKLSA